MSERLLTGRATHGVKISRGVVTHWHDEAITSYEEACRVLDLIEHLLGESGCVVNVATTLPAERS